MLFTLQEAPSITNRWPQRNTVLPPTCNKEWSPPERIPLMRWALLVAGAQTFSETPFNNRGFVRYAKLVSTQQGASLVSGSYDANALARRANY